MSVSPRGWDTAQALTYEFGELSLRKKQGGLTWGSQGTPTFSSCSVCQAQMRGEIWLLGPGHTFLFSYLLHPHPLATSTFSLTFSCKLMLSVHSGKCVRSQWLIVLTLFSSIYVLMILRAKAIKSFMESVMNCRFSCMKKRHRGRGIYRISFCQLLPNATPSNSTHTMY